MQSLKGKASKQFRARFICPMSLLIKDAVAQCSSALKVKINCPSWRRNSSRVNCFQRFSLSQSLHLGYTWFDVAWIWCACSDGAQDYKVNNHRDIPLTKWISVELLCNVLTTFIICCLYVPTLCTWEIIILQWFDLMLLAYYNVDH